MLNFKHYFKCMLSINEYSNLITFLRKQCFSCPNSPFLLFVLMQGIVIVGEESASGLDLGIFIASVVPGGPASRDGRIRPGLCTKKLSI